MNVLEWFAKLVGRQSPIDEIPLEQLVDLYAKGEPGDAYKEFIRRLSPIVYRAAVAYRRLHGAAEDLSEDATRLTVRVFPEFWPIFAAGDASHVLARLAEVVRRLMDADAFECIRTAFYIQLPLYHVADVRQKKLLALFYEEGLAVDAEGQALSSLARRASIPEDTAKIRLQQAVVALKRVINREFTPRELEEMTEGTLPGGWKA